MGQVTISGGQAASVGREREPYWLALSASGLGEHNRFTGCAFFLRAFSPGIAKVIFRVAEAGGLTIIAVGEAGPFLPPSVDTADLPLDNYFAEPHRVDSSEELFAALSTGHEQYRRWRDAVIGRGAGRRPLLQRLGIGSRSLNKSWAKR